MEPLPVSGGRAVAAGPPCLVTRPRRKGLLTGVVLVCLLCSWGCAPLPKKVEPLEVNIANLRLVNATLFEQSYALALRFQNPNRFTVPVEGVQYAVEINGQPFLTGLSNQKTEIPGLGSTIVELEGTSTLVALFRQLRELQLSEPVGYQLSGRLYLPDARSLAFEHQDELHLQELEYLLLQ